MVPVRRDSQRPPITAVYPFAQLTARAENFSPEPSSKGNPVVKVEATPHFTAASPWGAIVTAFPLLSILTPASPPPCGCVVVAYEPPGASMAAVTAPFGPEQVTLVADGVPFQVPTCRASPLPASAAVPGQVEGLLPAPGPLVADVPPQPARARTTGTDSATRAFRVMSTCPFVSGVLQ